MNNPEPETPNLEKPFELRFENRGSYLYAYVCGEHDSYEISMSFWREIAAECYRTGSVKLLVEEDIPEVVSLNDMYKIAAELAAFETTAICVAFVDRYSKHRDTNEFGELVASNRGLSVRIFDNFAEGEAWLLTQ